MHSRFLELWISINRVSWSLNSLISIAISSLFGFQHTIFHIHHLTLLVALSYLDIGKLFPFGNMHFHKLWPNLIIRLSEDDSCIKNNFWLNNNQNGFCSWRFNCVTHYSLPSKIQLWQSGQRSQTIERWDSFGLTKVAVVRMNQWILKKKNWVSIFWFPEVFFKILGFFQNRFILALIPS